MAINISIITLVSVYEYLWYELLWTDLYSNLSLDAVFLVYIVM
jgi:hypothetical protein